MDNIIWVNSPYIHMVGRSTERQGNLFRVEFTAVNEGKMVQDYETNETFPDSFVIAVGMGETEKIAYDRAIQRITEDHGQHIANEVRHV